MSCLQRLTNPPCCEADHRSISGLGGLGNAWPIFGAACSGWHDGCMTMENESLEEAARAVVDAQEALHAARRNLSGAMLAAYADGESVSRIAERTGRSTTDVWNVLAVRGITRGGNPSGPQLA